MSASKVSFSGVALSVFLAILPFTTSRHLFSGAINAKYFLIIGVVLLLALHLAYVLLVRRHELWFRGRWLLLLLGSSLAALYLTALIGEYPENSIFSTYLRSTGVLFLTAIAFLAFWAGEFLSPRDWSIVRRTIAGSAALFAFLTLLGSEGFGLSGRFLTVNLEIDGLTLGNSTFAGAYLLIAFSLTLIEFFRSDGRRTKWLLGAALAVQLLSPLLFNAKVLMGEVGLAELFSGPFAIVGTARASSVAVFMLIGYVLGYLLIRRFLSKRPTMNMLWAGVWLIGIAALLGMLFVPGTPVQEKYIELSTAARILVWEGAFGAVAEQPLFGWGPENFRFAIDGYFDNRLYLDENIGEIWFDRAHNLFLDTLINVGLFGFLVFAALTFYMVWVAVRAARAGIITPLEANIFGALIAAHVLQLQTSFDTVTSYTLMAFVLGYALSLERTLIRESDDIPPPLFQKGTAGILLVLALMGFVYLSNEYSRQKAFFEVFVPGLSRDEQVERIHKAMSRTSDFETLRLASASLAKGLFGELSAEEKKRNEVIIRGSVEQLGIFSDYWEAYLEESPDDYRARMNYAHQLLLLAVFGGDMAHLEEAKEVLDDSYTLSPENPLTYVLDALASLYSGDIPGAREKMDEALALNPDAPFTKNMAEYVEEQIASFPEITVIKLSNL